MLYFALCRGKKLSRQIKKMQLLEQGHESKLRNTYVTILRLTTGTVLFTRSSWKTQSDACKSTWNTWRSGTPCDMPYASLFNFPLQFFNVLNLLNKQVVPWLIMKSFTAHCASQQFPSMEKIVLFCIVIEELLRNSVIFSELSRLWNPLWKNG